MIQYNENYKSNIKDIEIINQEINKERGETYRFDIKTQGEGEGLDTLKTDMFTYASKYFISLFINGPFSFFILNATYYFTIPYKKLFIF